jgi:Flp pilus assembly protein TadB
MTVLQKQQKPPPVNGGHEQLTQQQREPGDAEALIKDADKRLTQQRERSEAEARLAEAERQAASEKRLIEADERMEGERERLESEKIVVSAPMSFSGSAARIWNWLYRRPAAVQNSWTKAGYGSLSVLLIALAWCVVLCWYAIIYVVLGLFFIPYRMIRHGQRKHHLDEQRHRELMEKMVH